MERRRLLRSFNARHMIHSGHSLITFISIPEPILWYSNIILIFLKYLHTFTGTTTLKLMQVDCWRDLLSYYEPSIHLPRDLFAIIPRPLCITLWATTPLPLDSREEHTFHNYFINFLRNREASLNSSLATAQKHLPHDTWNDPNPLNLGSYRLRLFSGRWND